ncbi:MAG: hypothetical protein J2P53_11050 [Bradyrhizobiaceae bacterium]|nr:hypothetical protein [Bradyrhizobiaceae bacterium]
MSVSTSKIAIAALLLALPAAAHADGPPPLDVSVSCGAAARAGLAAGRDKESCLADEHAAESQLGENWSKYSDADKTQCIGNVKTGGPASYVELLSCLEVMRDAKESRERDPLMMPEQQQQQQQPATSRPRRRK